LVRPCLASRAFLSFGSVWSLLRSPFFSFLRCKVLFPAEQSSFGGGEILE
jgi:hypothetical protein